MLSDGAAVLVAPRLGGIQHGQRCGQIGDVYTLPSKPGVPDPALIHSGKMQEEGIQQDIEIAMSVNHAP